MASNSSLMQTGSSLGLPDSWSLHSHLQMSEQPSWLNDDDLAYTRISVGAFMGSRTEALGSLDGDRGSPRVSVSEWMLLSKSVSMWVSLSGSRVLFLALVGLSISRNHRKLIISYPIYYVLLSPDSLTI